MWIAEPDEDRKRRFAGYSAIGSICFALYFLYLSEWGFGLGLCLIAYPYFLFSRYAEKRLVGFAMTFALIGATILSLVFKSPLIWIWLLWLMAWIVQVVMARSKGVDWPDPLIK